MATTAKIIFGTHTATMGANPTFKEATVVIFIKKIYNTLAINPIIMFFPTPSLDFLEETATPINVNI